MNVYYGYQIHDNQDGAELYVDTDPVAFFKQLAKELAGITEYKGRIETIEVGQVQGTNIEDALNQVRMEKWIPGTHGSAEGENNLGNDNE